MDNKRRWISYDWFKLITALALLILFIFLMLKPGQPEPVAVAGLPDYPAASFTWTPGTDGKTLLNPQGISLFTLSSDGKSWQPAIPPDLQPQLPTGFQLAQNAAGDWTIQDSTGNLLYTWDMSAFTWIHASTAAEPAALPTASLTPLPAAATESPTETSAATAAPTQTAITTGMAAETATPATTEAPTLEPTAAPAASATVAATTAPAATATVAATTAPTAGCQAPAPARLVIGQPALIRSNLNMRSEPLIGDNILQTNPTGMVLNVLDGPVCVPHQGSAYLWWQVETPDGDTGWSAETTLNGNFYFLEPVP